MEVRRSGKLKVYVYTRGQPTEQSPLEAALESIPPGVREFYRVEHLRAGAGSAGEWVSAIFRNRIFAEVRKLRPDGSVNRQPILSAEAERTPTGPFVVSDYLEEQMADQVTVRLLDGKTTGNTGWKKQERSDGKVYFSKSVDGKLYVLDRWAAINARIDGVLVGTGNASSVVRVPRRESFVSTVKVERRVMQAVPSRSYRAPEPQPQKKAPERKAFDAAAVLSRRHKELTQQSGRKAK